MFTRVIICFVGLAVSAVAQTQLSPPQQNAFKLQSVSPTPNALHVPRTSAVTLEFSDPVKESLLVPPHFHVFGRWSGVHTGTIATSRGGRRVDFTPTRPFSAGETVFVTLAKSITNNRGKALSRGFSFAFWADSRQSTMTYSLSDTLIPGITPYGAYGGDLNDDGWLDLAIPNEDTSDVSVFLNLGQGSFGNDSRYAVGFHCSPSEGVDFDFDGDVDLAVANILDNDMSVLMGIGDGTFHPQVRHGTGQQPRGLTVLDAEGDGDIDIVTANRISGGSLSLFLNQGNGVFSPEQRFQGGVAGETGLVGCDMNNDGFTDLVVAGFDGDNIAVLLNNGQGQFQIHQTRSIGDGPWMAVWGDLNGDGYNDIGVICSRDDAASIALNDGTGALLAPTFYAAGDFPIALDFGDLNGDGFLDLSTSSFSSGRFTMYLNDGLGSFGSVFTLPATIAGSCTVLHDIDNDGDVDITALDEIADRVFIYTQDG